MDATEFLTETLPQFFGLVFSHEVTSQALFMSFVLSIGGTALILKLIGFKFWFDPIPYFLALFLGSVLAHGMVGEMPLPGMAPLAQILLTSLVGMTAGTLALMGYLKPDVN